MQRRRLIRFLILLSVLSAFGRLCFYDFSWWDDQGTIHQNPSLNPPTLAKVARYWTAAGAHAPLGLYIPVTYSVWGVLAKVSYLEQPDNFNIHLNPWVFHSANVLVHACSALLVFAILRRLLENDWASAAGALLFALHPVQVEAVGWVSGMKDLLCGFFSLLAIWQYLLHAREPRRPKLHYALATIALVLAMLSKPTAMITPVIVLVLDAIVLRRRLKQIAMALGPWFVLSLACMISAKLSQSPAGIPTAPLWARPMIALDSLAFYIWKLLWPIHLTVDYGRTPIRVFNSGWFWYTWIVPAPIAALVIWIGRRHRPVLAGALIFFVGVLPVLGFTPFLFQFYSGVADHYLYLSMFGAALAAAYLLDRFASRRLAVSFGVVLLALAGLSFRQAGFWRDDLILWEHNIQINPRSFIACNNRGAALMRAGQLDKAEQEFRAALDIKPDYADAMDNLAMIYAQTGRTEQSIQQVQKLLQISQTLPPALRPGRLPLNQYQFGLVLMSRHEYAQAIEHFRAALELNPDLAPARQKLAEAQTLLHAQQQQPSTAP